MHSWFHLRQYISSFPAFFKILKHEDMADVYRYASGPHLWPCRISGRRFPLTAPGNYFTYVWLWSRTRSHCDGSGSWLTSTVPWILGSLSREAWSRCLVTLWTTVPLNLKSYYCSGTSRITVPWILEPLFHESLKTFGTRIPGLEPAFEEWVKPDVGVRASQSTVLTSMETARARFKGFLVAWKVETWHKGTEALL